MAQVYSFTDENGQTRLLAEIHPDPAGTPFNGGTITAPLTIHDSVSSAVDLKLVDAANRTDFAVGPGGETVVDPNVTYSLTNDSLIVKAVNGGGARSLVLFDRNGNEVWTCDRDGDVIATGNESRGSSSWGSNGNGTFIASAGATQASLIARAPNATHDAFEAKDSAGVIRARVDHGGAFVIALNAAPADGDLAAGDCALWFDSTDGVGNTKLMAKGKSADGTVLAATVAVLT